MNNHISEEIIEIGGKEYTLFLNRKGITTWENKTNISSKALELQKKENARKKKQQK